MTATRDVSLPTTSEHEVTLDAIVRYAGASGDFTPIHWDVDEARAAGYDRLFAMGMLPAGWLSELLVETFGDGCVRAIKVRFRSRTWLGQRVRCEVSAPGSDTARQFVVDIRATNSTGALLLDGNATIDTRPTGSEFR